MSTVQPRSRREALLVGASVYYPGTPCSKGHLSPYFVSGRRCCACRKEEAAQESIAKLRSQVERVVRKHAHSQYKIVIAPWQTAPAWALEVGGQFAWVWELEYYDGTTARGMSNADYAALENQLSQAAKRYAEQNLFHEDQDP